MATKKIVTTRTLYLFFSLIILAASAWAQSQPDNTKVPDTSDRKFVKGLGAHLLAVKDPQAFVREWLKPQTPMIESAKKIKAGEALGIIVLFGGCQERSGSCNAEVDYTIYKPDGSILAERLHQPLWKEAAPPKPNIQLGRAILAIQFQKNQPKGKYRIKATVKDLNADITIELETQIELKD
jgi:hypothetical protein